MTDVEQLITENLDVWGSAVKKRGSQGRGSSKKIELYGVKKLRELILELAVRGLLVPQNINDEPASILLEKMEAQKNKLIEDGVIKRPKRLPEITEEEIPILLPSGWEWERLGNITNYGSSDKAEAKNTELSTWVLELEDVEKETSKLLKKVRFKERQFKSSKNKFSKGDVIYGKLRPYLDKVLIADEAGVCTTEMIPLRAYYGVTPGFLRLVMKSPYFKLYANNSTHGMNLPRMGTDKARLALIPVIPEVEQPRIVAKVDELMALCDQLEQQQENSISAHQALVETLLAALTNAGEKGEFNQAWARIAEHFDTLFTTEHSIDQLKQTILQLAVMGKLVPQDPNDEPASVLLKKIAAEKERLIKDKKIKKQKVLPPIGEEEKPFELPEGWEWCRFDQMIDQRYPISYGVLVPGPDIENGVPFVRIGDIDIDNPPVLPDKSITSEIDEQYARTRLVGGELLMAVVGSIGKLGVVPDSWIGANIARALCRVMPNKNLSKSYLLFLLKSEFMQVGFLGDTRTVAQPTLNVGLIRQTLTPVPPIKEQKRIVEEVDQLMLLCENLKARIKESQTTQLHLADAMAEQAIG